MTKAHEVMAATVLDGIGGVAPALGALLGPEGAAAAALVASLTHSVAEALRRKGGEMTLEHIRMPPTQIRDFTKP